MFSSKKTAIVLVSVFFVTLDRFLKSLFYTRDINYKILGDWLYLNFSANKFIAFSIPLSGVILELAISAIILILIFALIYSKFKKRPEALALLFIILGAANNLFDRIKYGYVIDYVHVLKLTALNISDTMITLGAGAILLIYIKADFINKNKKN